MARFNSDLFLTQQAGNPEETVTNIGTAFGVPACLFDLPLPMAQLIPTSVLAPLKLAMMEAQAKTDAVIKKIASWFRTYLGINIFPDRDGTFLFMSKFSKWGMDGPGAFLEAIGSFMGAVNSLSNAAAQLYENYQNTIEQIEDIKDCFGQLKAFLENSSGQDESEINPAQFADPDAYKATVQGNLAFAKSQLEEARMYNRKAASTLMVIDKVLAERALDPSREPTAKIEDPEFVETVFRLEFGPPRASSGKFILSVDGLYYDSQSDGIQPALLELSAREELLPRETHWKLEFDPSIGGRGIPTTSDDLKYYFNSILDPNIIDDSDAMENFYSQDRALVSLVGQKNRKVFDVSSDLSDLQESGSSEVLIDNLKQVMISETQQFSEKINKRKKQIELAVKLPTFYGKGTLYSPGNVPVNDFSYLEGVNFLLDVESQRKIVLNQEDVTGVVLPLEVKYTQRTESADPVSVDHLLLANIAKGAIIDDNAPSSTAPRLTINDSVIIDSLVALYNFLSTKSSTAGSDEYGVFNSANNGISYNSQVVGEVSSILRSGVGLAYLDGIAKLSQDNNSVVSGMGNFIKLPEKREFQDFLFSKDGGTFETWIQASGLTTSSYYDDPGGVSGLYRLILANENTGLTSGYDPQPNREELSLDNGTGVVRGMVMGFTRDARFTKNTAPTNSNDQSNTGNPASAAAFFIAPTQSYDHSSVGFINDNPCNADNTRWHSLTVPVNDVVNEVSFSSCNTNLCHLAVTFDPKNNLVSVYLDTKLIASEGYRKVFGRDRITPSIPSLALSSSFEYNENRMNTSSVAASKEGPGLDTYFTPWIIGGGYTDGNPDGNFMGGEYGGKISGLKGYLGGIKFYSTPLSQSEITQNYNATQNFFKRVDLL